MTNKFFTFSDDFVIGGLEVAARACAIVALAFLFNAILGRRRAVWRSSVWNTTVLGLLALPLAVIGLPRLPIAVLPPKSSEFAEFESGEASVRFAPSSPVTELAPTLAGESPPPSLATAAPPIERAGSESEEVGRSAEIRIGWYDALLVVYVIGVLWGLIRLAASIRAVNRLVESGVDCADTRWLNALSEITREFGLRRAPRLLVSDLVATPLTAGRRNPALMLPQAVSRRKDDASIKAVLVHELCHISRRDYSWNLLLRVVRVIYWPHPLMPLVERYVRSTREQACDDLCVNRLGASDLYRETLLELAAGLAAAPSPTLGLGLAIADTSRLRVRIAWINRTSGSPIAKLGKAAFCVVAAGAAATSGLLAAVQLARADADAETSRPVPNARPRIERNEGPTQVEKKPAPAVKEAGPPDGNAVKPTPRTMSLRVLDAATGKPIERAVVKQARDWKTIRHYTDATGQVRLTASEHALFTPLVVDVYAEGYILQRQSWPKSEDDPEPIPASAEIKLNQGRPLGGYVRDEDGRPIAGAVILLWSHNYRRQAPGELFYHVEAVTDDQGKWVTRSAPDPSGEIISMELAHPNYMRAKLFASSPIPPPTLRELQAGTGVTVMRKGTLLEGVVTGSDGKPLAGATVMLAEPERVFIYETIHTTTDQHGRYRFGATPSGTIPIIVMAKNHAPKLVERPGGTPTPRLDVSLEPGRVIRGRIADSNGNPVTNATVYPSRWKMYYRAFDTYLLTDSDGRFQWNEAPRDDVQITAVKNGYISTFFRNVPASENNVFITFRESIYVRGDVVDAENAKPIHDAAVFLGRADPVSGEVFDWAPPNIGPDQVRVSSGRLYASFEAKVDAYRLKLQAEGYEEWISPVIARGKKTPPLDVRLRRLGAGLTIITVDSEGKPARGTKVYYLRTKDELHLLNSKTIYSPDCINAETDDDGKAVFPLPQSPVTLIALHDSGYAIVKHTDLLKAPRVALRPFGRVEGVLKIGGAVAPRRRITIDDFTQGALDRRAVKWNWATETDERGRFAVERVIAGDWMIGIKMSSNLAPRANYWHMAEPITVKVGETTRAEFGAAPRATIQGKVISGVDEYEVREHWRAYLEPTRRDDPISVSYFVKGSPLPADQIDLRRQAWKAAPGFTDYMKGQVRRISMIDSDGAFRITDVPPGSYRLILRHEDDGNRSMDLKLAPQSFFVSAPAAGGVVDLGTLTLKPRDRSDAPVKLSVTTTDGKRLDFESLRGKYVIISLEDLSSNSLPDQVAQTADRYRKYGKDDRVRFVSLVIATDDRETRDYLRENAQPWPRAVVGPALQAIHDLFDLPPQPGRATIVLGPDGRRFLPEKPSYSMLRELDRVLK